MTSHNEELKFFREQLKQVCEYSGRGMCPGCGLTPEGLDKFTASHNEAPANANEISNNLAEAQKTNEDLIAEYRELMKVHQSNMQVVELLDRPEIEIRIPFLEDWLTTILTLKDEAHKKEMEEAVKAERERIQELAKTKLVLASRDEWWNGGDENIMLSDLSEFKDLFTPTKEVTEEAKPIYRKTNEGSVELTD